MLEGIASGCRKGWHLARLGGGAREPHTLNVAEVFEPLFDDPAFVVVHFGGILAQ